MSDDNSSAPSTPTSISRKSTKASSKSTPPKVSKSKTKNTKKSKSKSDNEEEEDEEPKKKSKSKSKSDDEEQDDDEEEAEKKSKSKKDKKAKKDEADDEEDAESEKEDKKSKKPKKEKKVDAEEEEEKPKNEKKSKEKKKAEAEAKKAGVEKAAPAEGSEKKAGAKKDKKADAGAKPVLSINISTHPEVYTCATEGSPKSFKFDKIENLEHLSGEISESESNNLPPIFITNNLLSDIKEQVGDVSADSLIVLPDHIPQNNYEQIYKYATNIGYNIKYFIPKHIAAAYAFSQVENTPTMENVLVVNFGTTSLELTLVNILNNFVKVKNTYRIADINKATLIGYITELYLKQAEQATSEIELVENSDSMIRKQIHRTLINLPETDDLTAQIVVNATDGESYNLQFDFSKVATYAKLKNENNEYGLLGIDIVSSIKKAIEADLPDSSDINKVILVGDSSIQFFVKDSISALVGDSDKVYSSVEEEGFLNKGAAFASHYLDQYESKQYLRGIQVLSRSLPLPAVSKVVVKPAEVKEEKKSKKADAKEEPEAEAEEEEEKPKKEKESKKEKKAEVEEETEAEEEEEKPKKEKESKKDKKAEAKEEAEAEEESSPVEEEEEEKPKKEKESKKAEAKEEVEAEEESSPAEEEEEEKPKKEKESKKSKKDKKAEAEAKAKAEAEAKAKEAEEEEASDADSGYGSESAAEDDVELSEEEEEEAPKPKKDNKKSKPKKAETEEAEESE